MMGGKSESVEKGECMREIKGFFRETASLTTRGNAGTLGKLSMSRILAFCSAVAGLAVVAVGLYLVFAHQSTADKDLVGFYKEILVAGVGIFGAGSISKAVNKLGEKK